jgi:Mg/Co/Ni transporter MgtE
VPDIDPLEAWCRQEEAVLRQQLQLLESSKIGTYEGDKPGSDRQSGNASEIETDRRRARRIRRSGAYGTYGTPARERLLSQLDSETRASLVQLLAYPENTAGRIMMTEFVGAASSWTVGETLNHIRMVESTRDQATSLLIRAIALQEVQLRDWWHIALRELPTEVILGAILGIVGVVRIAVWQNFGILDYGKHWILIACTVGAALVGIVTFGSLVGSMLPFM